MNIEEFAKRVGVSIATVSRATSGRGRISNDTREMILLKMQELGYTPNLNARRLATGRSFFVALTIIGFHGHVDLFTLELAAAIMQPLKSRGYDLLINALKGTPEEYNLLKQRVQSRAIDGTILFGFGIDPSFLKQIAKSYHPCVTLTRLDKEIPHVAAVVPGLSTGCRQVAEYLTENGHTRIGFIDSGYRDEVLQMFKVELKKHGLELPETRIAVIGEGVSNGFEAMDKIIRKPSPPTAIWCRTDILALEAIQKARELGLRIPEDISIIGHDDLPLVSLINPSLTTVKVDRNTQGNLAADALFKMIEQPDLKLPAQYVETELVIRGTVGRVAEV